MYSDDNTLAKDISIFLLSNSKNVRLLNLLSEKSDFMFLSDNYDFDYIILVTDNTQKLSMIDSKDKMDILIVISSNPEIMTLSKDKFHCLNYSEGLDNIGEKLLRLIEIKHLYLNNVKTSIIHELYSIGFKPYHKGTNYLIDSTYMVYNKEAHLCDNFEKNIYPIIAKKYDTSVNNVKSNIIKSINSMYAECELNKLKKYFHFTTDFKPTPKMIIYTVISNVARK